MPDTTLSADRSVLRMIRNAALSFIAGMLLNIITIELMGFFELPITLGTLGTMLAAALGGYLPGVIVAFCTNLFYSVGDYSHLSYSFLDMLAALLTSLFVAKGYYRRLWKTLLTVPVLVIITGVCTYIVSLWLGNAQLDLVTTLLHELADKGITVTITYLSLRFLPEQFQVQRRSIEEEAKQYRRSRLLSIRAKILIMSSIVCLLVAAIVTGISFIQFRETIINEHYKLGQGIIDLIRNDLDPERVDEFIEKGHDAEGYDELERHLLEYREHYPDVQYLYIYQMHEEGIRVVFDLDTEEFPADEPGDLISYELVLADMKDDLIAGKHVEPTISDDIYGFVYSVYEPIYNAEGECVCYAAVDFSMDIINSYNRTFLFKVITMFIGFVMLIFTICIKVMEQNIIFPVNDMAHCAESFAYNSEEARLANVRRIRDLNIRTGDEIEDLYQAFLKTTEDSMQFVEGLRKAKSQVQSMEQEVSRISVTAYTDALTGVRNKAAYNRTVEELELKIMAGMAKFAIVMIDLNHLKRVNDTYGHEHGDCYLKGACSIICNHFRHSQVFRIGGDEFVVLLTGKSYDQCDALVEDIEKQFTASASDTSKEPWERYSAAIGAASFTKDLDEHVDSVFKRADSTMYANKIRMKAQRTD